MMKIYAVGGSVRDQLLGLPVQDKDYVVVGATPKMMQSLGYRVVRQHFPVFLHPVSQEAYALARIEKKVAPGYHGFIVDSHPSVTLEEDLARRDLTINAMAKDIDGRIIDPFGGQQDLAHGLLRHVSASFVEDPLRVFRVARFAARFGFKVHPKTQQLMKTIVQVGEIATLPFERIWQELAKGLMEPHPFLWLQTLDHCGALFAILPEIVPKSLLQNPKQRDFYEQSLQYALQHHFSLAQRFAIVLCALLNRFSYFPQTTIDDITFRLKAPTFCKKIVFKSLFMVHVLGQIHACPMPELLRLFHRVNILSSKRDIPLVLGVLEALEKTCFIKGVTEERLHALKVLLTAAQSVNAKMLLKDQKDPCKIQAVLTQARIAALQEAKRSLGSC